MPDLSTITYNGTQYQIKDTQSRVRIDAITARRLISPINDWQIGQISFGGGVSGVMQNKLRTTQFLDSSIQLIYTTPDYAFILSVWDHNNQWIGYWALDNFFATTQTETQNHNIYRITPCFLKDCPVVENHPTPYKFKIMLQTVDNTGQFTNDPQEDTKIQVAEAIQNIFVYTYIDSSLTLPNVAADAKTVGDKLTNLTKSLTEDFHLPFIQRSLNATRNGSGQLPGNAYYDARRILSPLLPSDITYIRADAGLKFTLWAWSHYQLITTHCAQTDDFLNTTELYEANTLVYSISTDSIYQLQNSSWVDVTITYPKRILNDVNHCLYTQLDEQIFVGVLANDTTTTPMPNEYFTSGATSYTELDLAARRLTDGNVNQYAIVVSHNDGSLILPKEGQGIHFTRSRLAPSDVEELFFYPGVFIKATNSITNIDISDLTATNLYLSTQYFKCHVGPCKPGDIFFINSTIHRGAVDPKAYTILDANGDIITRQGPSYKGFYTIPEDGAYIAIDTRQYTDASYKICANSITANILQEMSNYELATNELISWSYNSGVVNPYSKVNFTDSNEMQRIHSIAHLHINSAGNFREAYKNHVRHFAGLRYHPSVPPIPDYDNQTYDVGSQIFDYHSLPEASDIVISPGAEHPWTSLFDPKTNQWNKLSNVHILAPGSTDWSGFDFPGRKNSTGTTVLYQDKYTDRMKSLIEHLPYYDAGGVIITHPSWTKDATTFENFDMARFVEDCLDFHPLVLGTDVIESGRLRQVIINAGTSWKQVTDNLLTNDEVAAAVQVTSSAEFISPETLYYYEGNEEGYVNNRYYRAVFDWQGQDADTQKALSSTEMTKIAAATVVTTRAQFESIDEVYYHNGNIDEPNWPEGFYHFVGQWQVVDNLTQAQKKAAITVTQAKNFTATNKIYYYIGTEQDYEQNSYYKYIGAWEAYPVTNIVFDGHINIWDKTGDNQDLIDGILQKGKRCWMYAQGDWTPRRGCNELLVPTTINKTTITLSSASPSPIALTPEEKSRQCLKAYRYGNFFARLMGADTAGDLSPVQIKSVNFNRATDFYSFSISTPIHAEDDENQNLSIKMCIVTITANDIIKEYSDDTDVNEANSGLTLTIDAEKNTQTFTKTNIPEDAKAVRAFAFIPQYTITENTTLPYYKLSDFLTQCTPIKEAIYDFLYREVMKNETTDEFATEIKAMITRANLQIPDDTAAAETVVKNFIRNYRLDNYEDIVFTNPIMITPATTRTFIPAYGR